MSFTYRALAAALGLAASINATAGAQEGSAGPAPTSSNPGLKVATRSMSSLRIAATIPIGKTADWVAVASDGVWIGSTGPFAVSEIDPNTNRITRVELPGEHSRADSPDLLDLMASVAMCRAVEAVAQPHTTA